MTEWRPIKTAPKDGTRILVWRKNEEGYSHLRCGIDMWRRNNWMRSRRDMQPTHWMPLPYPPRKENETL